MDGVEEVHRRILVAAAQLANDRVSADMELPFEGATFDPNPINGLCLEIRPGVPEEYLPTLENYAVNAIADAIVSAEIREDFVGLIVGAARQGGNYFDYFA